MSSSDGNKLEDPTIRDFIKEVSGEEALQVVKELQERGTAVDEELVENVELELNDVRRILYQLYQNGLAEYTRSRNSNTGWITYTWKLSLDNAENVMEKRKKQIVEELEERLVFEEENVFYLCPENHVKLTFEEATDIDFKCPECGEGLMHHENEEIIEEIKKEIKRLKDSI
ncbi:Transcription initiation factor IIE alpha subunit [Methanonatronarchaeum thermophilum]|uniref:Transcription factor E n=1 Tax=Methanonatronarchaeum thermophilum TaxID=1927129 RepID=A0A1Y3GB60_9EURY|nr:transcription factor E [Methanonatronarchaeum thermophilum]OUJ18480.1 Transcription initiation factor IIE alpha subunit [Methanonatronarchaeum thermophilum]